MPGRLEGWAFFFLEKKRKPSCSSWPTRVAQGLRESLAKIIQIDVRHEAGQKETMKASCSGSQTGRNPLAALFPDHRRFLLCFAFFIIKNLLMISVFHGREFFHLVFIYLPPSCSGGWGARLSSAPTTGQVQGWSLGPVLGSLASLRQVTEVTPLQVTDS